ncbi:Sodium/hydrogen exchanger 9B2 [Homalodisca vitripennis]|nr:Sodium/hydrogen exchanger 9B2 [Homalodisca vitripennis]
MAVVSKWKKEVVLRPLVILSRDLNEKPRGVLTGRGSLPFEDFEFGCAPQRIRHKVGFINPQRVSRHDERYKDIQRIRVLTCSLVLVGGKLNFKEVVFVNLAWLPKATVQAALAPQALDMVRKMTAPPPEDLERGSQFLTIAVLSILITAPLGAIGASVAGPRLLSKHSSNTSSPNTNSTRQPDHNL